MDGGIYTKLNKGCKNMNKDGYENDREIVGKEIYNSSERE